ncbi:MAG: hypothetical protein DRG78_05735 [Epsilonproteobacteria bacterium]|nr:MAG: hypothetical protein DRG78_05735 [Campylobacterota bacterium]
MINAEIASKIGFNSQFDTTEGLVSDFLDIQDMLKNATSLNQEQILEFYLSAQLSKDSNDDLANDTIAIYKLLEKEKG